MSPAKTAAERKAAKRRRRGALQTRVRASLNSCLDPHGAYDHREVASVEVVLPCAPTYTEQQIADACMAAEVPDSKCESVLLALKPKTNQRSSTMIDDRFKQIMEQLGMPNSRSLLEALRQVANEAAQEALVSRGAAAGWQPTPSAGQVQPPPRRP